MSKRRWACREEGGSRRQCCALDDLDINGRGSALNVRRLELGCGRISRPRRLGSIATRSPGSLILAPCLAPVGRLAAGAGTGRMDGDVGLERESMKKREVAVFAGRI